jgi:mannosyltransferase
MTSTATLDLPRTIANVPVRRTAAALGALGALVSMLGSWIPSLWGDEAASLLSAERSVPSLLGMITHVDAVHGTYYLGLHFWIMLAGTSPFAIRLPSALAIGACVAAIVLIGTLLDSLTLGVIAGVVCMVLPRVTSMGQETRSYAFSAAIAAWLTVLLLGILRQQAPSRRRWIAYAVLVALSIYVFLYLALIAIAHLALILLRDDRGTLARTWAKVFGIAVLIASPLIVTGILEHGQIAYLGTRTEITFPTLTVGLWFGNVPFAVLAWALIAAALLFFAFDWRTRTTRLRLARQQLPSATLVGAAWLFIPSILLIGSHFLVPDFTARYLSMCAPATALLMAVAIRRIAKRRVAFVVLCLLVVAAVAAPNWLQQRGPYAKNHSDWAEISSRMATLAKPGDAVVFDESVRPSRLPRLAMNTYPAGFDGLDDVTLKTPFYDNTTWHDDVYTIAEAARLGRFDGVRKVWMVEYAIGSKIDTDGIGDLTTLGFRQDRTIKDYRSAIIEFTRP